MKSVIAILGGVVLAGAVAGFGGCAQTGPSEGVVFVSPAEQEARMYRLNYVGADEAARVAADVSNVATMCEETTNTLVLKGDAAELDKAEAFIKKLDVAPPPVSAAPESTVVIYQLKFAQADEICTLLLQMERNGMIDGEESPFAVVSERRTNSLVIMMDRRYEKKTQELLARLDVPVEKKQ